MIIGQFLNPFSVYKNGYNFFFLFYFHLINYKIYVYREKIQFFLYAMYATRFVLTNSTIYYFVPFHPFFICFETLQTFTYREIGFFQTTAFVSTNSAIFSFVSSPSFFFFFFLCFGSLQNSKYMRKIYFHWCDDEFQRIQSIKKKKTINFKYETNISMLFLNHLRRSFNQLVQLFYSC